METTEACPPFLRASYTIAAKDLRSEMRTKEAFNASFAFSLVILVLFSFAFDPSSEELRTISGGLLWLVFSFAGALVLNRSFARELQNDCLDALISSGAGLRHLPGQNFSEFFTADDRRSSGARRFRGAL